MPTQALVAEGLLPPPQAAGTRLASALQGAGEPGAWCHLQLLLLGDGFPAPHTSPSPEQRLQGAETLRHPEPLTTLLPGLCPTQAGLS